MPPTKAAHSAVGHLVAWGAPLWGEAAQPTLPLEEALVAGLQAAQSHGTVLRVLPFLVAKHHHRLNWARLKALAHEADQEGELGWLLGLTAQLVGRTDWLHHLEDLTPHTIRRHLPQARGRHEAKLREAQSGPLGKRWGLWVDEDPSLFEGPIRLHLWKQHLAQA